MKFADSRSQRRNTRSHHRTWRDILEGITPLIFSPVAIGVLACIGLGICSIHLGQDLNWDLKNYHYYNGFAILTGALNHNVAPAQIQTFFNPSMDVPIYLMIAHLPPKLVGFLLGFFQGINFVLVYLLARLVLSRMPFGSYMRDSRRSMVALLCALVGVTAPMFVSEIGTTMGDSITSVFVLAALLLVFQESRRNAPLFLLAGGFTVGIAAGLKLSNMVYVVALFACAWWLRPHLKDTLKALGMFVAGTCVGFLSLQGYWSAYLLEKYGSPLFPFYNALFRSPYADPVNWTDTRFIPHSILDALSYPFQWAVGLHPSAELPFRDLRFAIIAVLMALWIVVASVRIYRQRKLHVSRVGFHVMLFFIFSFGLWLFVFGIQRYAIVLELLSGIALLLLLENTVQIRRIIAPAFAIVAAVVVFTTVPPSWGRISWSSNWFGVKVPSELTSNSQMVVMLGSDPVSYVIPSFPSDTEFVRIDGNFVPSQQTGFAREAREAIASHVGPIYALSLQKLTGRQIASLGSYGLAVDPGPGLNVISRFESVHVFPLSRSSGK